ncbi:MAG: hypothetical protein WDZ49_17095 [Litorilinea sp.]
MSEQFLEANFTGSLKHPRFFNGRVLTATDLQDEQKANVRRALYLGQAAGEGVVYGLYVARGDAPGALAITAGLAISRQGDALYMPSEATQLILAPRAREVAASDSPFITCAPVDATTVSGAVSMGFYVLAIAPASRLSQSFAPHSGLNSSGLNSSGLNGSGLNGGVTPCTNRYEEVGVQFKLIPVPQQLIEPIDATSSKRRNRLAHACFGTPGLEPFAIEPLKQVATLNLLERLRSGSEPGLRACDVPLAVLQYRTNAVDFVDVWSVRRPCLWGQHPDMFPADTLSIDGIFAQFGAPGRALDAMAVLLQFQNQLEEIRTDNGVTPPAVAAATYFDYLPAAGYLPAGTTDAHTRRFRVGAFFGNFALEIGELDPGFVRSLFNESFAVAPLRVSGDMAVDLYTVRGADPAEPFVIFARRAPLTVQTPPQPTEPEPSAPAEEPPQVRTGDLIVTVLNEFGGTFPHNLIESVTAYHHESRTTTPAIRQRVRSSLGFGREERGFQFWKEQAQEDTYSKYSAYLSRHGVENVYASIWNPVDEEYVYVFNNLPVGRHTIMPNPMNRYRSNFGGTGGIYLPGYSSGYYGISKDVQLSAGARVYESVHIRREYVDVPTDPCIDLGEGSRWLPGVVFDCLPFIPELVEIWPGWPDDIPWPDPRDPGWIDPPPDDWLRLDDIYVTTRVEEILGQKWGGRDPKLVIEDPVVYIRQGYNPTHDPTQASQGVDAFVQTRDGTRFPMLVVAADNALTESVPVTRTEIPEFDAPTYARMQAYGLGDLATAAAAPPGLLAAVLGESEANATSLVSELRTTLAEDFQGGVMGLRGMNRGMNNAFQAHLRTLGIEGKVGLANLSQTTIAEILVSVANESGEAAEARRTRWNNYAERLLTEVREVVPRGAYDLSTTEIAPEVLQALAAQNVTTFGQLFEYADGEQGGIALNDQGLTPQTLLQEHRETIVTQLTTGYLLTAPTKSIATLTTPELAFALATEGIYDTLSLLTADVEQLSVNLELTAQLETAINAATDFSFGSVHANLMPQFMASDIPEGTAPQSNVFENVTPSGFLHTPEGAVVTNEGLIEFERLEAIEGIEGTRVLQPAELESVIGIYTGAALNVADALRGFDENSIWLGR